MTILTLLSTQKFTSGIYNGHYVEDVIHTNPMYVS